jgi:hypothetical protein
MNRVLREPPFDRLRVVRELEPQDPEGNRGAKTQRTPSINEITNSKSEIRNSKQMESKTRSTKSETRNKKGKLKILISKHLNTREKFLLEGFGF